MTKRIWMKSPLDILVEDGVDAGGGIVVQGNRIEAILQSGEQPNTAVDETFDASEHIVLPGLINTHHHYYQTLTRALPESLNKGLFPWLKSLYPVWAGLDEEMIYHSSRLACAELMLSGCTTSADHHYLFPKNIPHALDIQVEAVTDLGIRSVLTRGSMSVGEEQGGLPPESTIQDEETILQDCERVINRYHDRNPGSMLSIALAPCSPFSVSKSLMMQSKTLAEKHGVRLHTHLAETRDENQFCLDRFRCRPLEYLEEVGWLNDQTWLAHGIHFNSEEIGKLGDAGTAICHCPSSNMMLGSGQCKVNELVSAGSPVGLGVDGSASNDCSNLMQEVRQAFLIQRLQYGAANFSHQSALGLATTGSAACLGRTDIGQLCAGRQADIAMFKPDELKFSGAGDAMASLVLCNADRVDRLMIDGRWQVQDGELVNCDRNDLQSKHQSLAVKLQSG